MIYGKCLILYRQLCAATVRELFSMEFDFQPMGFGCCEYPFCLFGGKGNVLTKYIHCIRQLLSGNGRHHLRTDMLNVIIRPVFVFRWQSVGTQKCTNDSDRVLAGQQARSLKHFGFGFCIQTVSGFDFQCGDPFSQ